MRSLLSPRRNKSDMKNKQKHNLKTIERSTLYYYYVFILLLMLLRSMNNDNEISIFVLANNNHPCLRNILLSSNPYHTCSSSSSSRSTIKGKITSKSEIINSSSSSLAIEDDTNLNSNNIIEKTKIKSSINDLKAVQQCSTKTKPTRPNMEKEELFNNNGFYYGIGGTILKNNEQDNTNDNTNEHVETDNNNNHNNFQQEQQKMNNYQYNNDNNNSMPPMVITKFIETMNEFRENMDDIRDTLQGLKQELNDISNYLKGKSFQKSMDDDDNFANVQRTKKQKYESMSNDIETWANNLIVEGTTDWKDIMCNKFFREKLNGNDTIKCYLKWLPDSRKRDRDQQKYNDDDGDDANGNTKETLYPCMKIISTIDAPYECVCSYLSNPLHISEYNDLVIQHEDVEDISPNSKICWSSCPQILFLKPRDFVTFCCLKWKNHGDMQLVLSEAVDHDSLPGYDGDDNDNINDENGKRRFCRAFALRGANFISRHPEHYDKTLLILLAHASPGGNLPSWSVKTAINALAPIEPFKICHKIEVGSKKLMLSSSSNESNNNKDNASKISYDDDDDDDNNNIYNRPGGLSQLGYACFWPHGGGAVE